MARKPALNVTDLADLGAEKLAQLIVDEAARNTGFRRQVKAALAGKSGPEAIAKLIDRRLSGLERARSFIEWDKAKAFGDDLRSLIHTITAELGPASPTLAIDRLLRFLASHEDVFERVDDSSGAVQDVYYDAIIYTGDLAKGLDQNDADLLPGKIMAALGESSHGYLADVVEAVAPHLPQDTLTHWDIDLGEAIAERLEVEAVRDINKWYYSMASQWKEMRQTIAVARGDLDLVIALESQKHSRVQDTVGVATKLLEANRLDEALEWVRKPGQQTIRSSDDDDTGSSQQVEIEARILEALGDKPAAQTLRLKCFETYLSPDILRAYLKVFPDFEDIEAEEKAMAAALNHSNPQRALQLFLDWPRLDLAALVVIRHHRNWDGGDWHSLPKVAGMLEHEYPLAATILYRALLDSILAKARSKAYGHGAKYLQQLELLASNTDVDKNRPAGMLSHQRYHDEMQANHKRKSGFWAKVAQAEAGKIKSSRRQNK